MFCAASQAYHLFSTDLKKNRLKEIQDRYKKNILPRMKVYSYKSFYEKPLNNAKILSLATYTQDLSDFEKLYEHFNQNLELFLNFCKSLEKSEDPVSSVKQVIQNK